MKILFATPHLFPDVIGGSGLHSYHLIRILARAGHDLDVLHPYPSRHFPDFPRVHEVTLPFGRTVFDFARRVKAWIGDRQYDVGYSDGLSLLRYMKHRTFPCIVNDHGFLQCHPQYFASYLRASPRPALKDLILYWPRIWARRHIARAADFVVSMGGLMDDVVAHKLQVPPARTLHLPNAIARNPAVAPGTGDPQLFLFVGTIEFRKGVSLLLRTFAQLEHSGARLRFVGDGPMAQAVHRCGLANVTWVGTRLGEDLQREYQAAGNFVFPTLQEGMPTVVLEALSHGKVVITADTGANRLLVTPETGLLIPPHDTAALTAAVKQVMAMAPAQRTALGRAGQELVRARYTWPRVARAYRRGFHHAASHRNPAMPGHQPVDIGF